MNTQQNYTIATTGHDGRTIVIAEVQHIDLDEEGGASGRDSITLGASTFHNINFQRAHYGNNTPMFRIWNNDGQVCDITVNVDEHPADGCIWVKTWSENTGIEAELERIGFATRTGRTTPCAYDANAVEMRVHPVTLTRHNDGLLCTESSCDEPHTSHIIDRLNPAIDIELPGGGIRVQIDLEHALEPETIFHEAGIYLTDNGARQLADAWASQGDPNHVGAKYAWDQRELDDEPIVLAYVNNTLDYIQIEDWWPNHVGCFNLASFPWPDHIGL